MILASVDEPFTPRPSMIHLSNQYNTVATASAPQTTRLTPRPMIFPPPICVPVIFAPPIFTPLLTISSNQSRPDSRYPGSGRRRSRYQGVPRVGQSHLP